MTEDIRRTDGRVGPEGMVVDIVIRLALLGVFVYWSFQIIGPFVMIGAWGLILTVAMYPIYTWLKGLLGGRGGLAAFLITLLGFVIVLGPAAALAVSLVETVQHLAAGLKAGTLKVPPPAESVRAWPLVGESLYNFWSLAATNLRELISGHASVVFSAGGTFLGKIAGLGGGVLLFAASILISGFLYKPGPALTRWAGRFATRIVGGRGETFVHLAGATIRNVSRGVIGISLLQSLAAGVVLIVAGVPGAGLIALGVLILGIIQVGPGILMIPVIIWAWTSMDTVSALIFTVFMVPITFMDNILKPIVMARGLETPMSVIFIGVLGGTLAYGLVGLFLGPIVLAVFYELLVAWMGVGESEKDAKDA